MTIKFEANKAFNVLGLKTLRPNKAGELQVSQKPNKEGETFDTIDETVALTYKERKDGKHFFLMPDGREVIGHITHFDPANGYNTGKKGERTAPRESGSLQKQIEYRRGVVERCRLEVAKQEKKLAELTAALPPAPVADAPWANEANRDEARALLNSIGADAEPVSEEMPAIETPAEAPEATA